MAPGVSGDPAVEFRLLGAFEVVARGQMVKLGSMRLRLVLAMLALAGGRVVSADSLAESCGAAIRRLTWPTACRASSRGPDASRRQRGPRSPWPLVGTDMRSR